MSGESDTLAARYVAEAAQAGMCGWLAAARSDGENAADRMKTFRSKAADPLNEPRLGYRHYVVESQGTRFGHAIGLVECHLGRNSSYPARRWNGDHSIHHWDRGLTGNHEVGTPLLIWRLGPPQLTAIHHGSASMLATAKAITSIVSSSAGERLYPARIALSMAASASVAR
ncbi:MAG: hypothetical protein ACYDEP_08720 [Acidimicrobiales bacterium]